MLHVRIRDARIAAGLTQAKLAALADIPRSVVQDLESPGHDVRISTLRKVAAHLPNLHPLLLALDGADFTDPRDTAAAREALTAIITTAQQLLERFGGQGAPEGRIRAGAANLDEPTRKRIAQLDAMVDRGDVPLDEES